MEWAVWEEWVEWECSPKIQTQNSKRAVFTALFFCLLQNSTTKEQRSLFSSSEVYNIKYNGQKSF